MISDLAYLAWRYVAFHRWKTAILVTSITLIIYLPVGLNVLITESSAQLTARAGATPLIVGAKGSPVELTLNSLYFDSATPSLSHFGEVARIRETGLAAPVPVYVRFNVRDHPIVGTSLDYFEFRGLRIAEGRNIAVLGEAVIGARVARELDIGPGDSVISSPENVFDLAGIYPLKMKVTGVLAPTFTADDAAVFVDIRTAWIMQGLGHGHQDLSAADAGSAVLNRDGNRIIANASVAQYNEITAENIDSFHFHGDDVDFPVTAILVIPADQKSGVILQGRYANADGSTQILQPVAIIDELLDTVLTIQQFVIAAVVIVGSATVATTVLVFLLSIRLRRRERLTLFKIGGARSTVAGLLLAEVIAVIAFSLIFAAALTALTRQFGDEMIRALLLS